MHYIHVVSDCAKPMICKIIGDLALVDMLNTTIKILEEVLESDALQIHKEHMPFSIEIDPTASLGSRNPDAGLVADILNTTRIAIQKVDTSQSLIGMTLYVHENDIHTFPTTPSLIRYKLIGINMVDGVTCTYCKQHICKSELDIHLLDPQCYLTTETLKVKEKGFEQIFDTREMIAVRQSVISEYKMVPSYLNFYVPPWVAQALKIYRESSGYAGMSLAEFLVTMKPT